jgi:hypothetical protein
MRKYEFLYSEIRIFVFGFRIAEFPILGLRNGNLIELRTLKSNAARWHNPCLVRLYRPTTLERWRNQMELALVQIGDDCSKNERTARPKNPVLTIESCPMCGSRSLLKLNVDVLCGACDWDSTFAYVAAGGMDHLIAAARDHFLGSPQPKLDPGEEVDIPSNSKKSAR